MVHIPVRPEETMVIADRVEADLDLVGGEVSVGVLSAERLNGPLLFPDFQLDLLTILSVRDDLLCGIGHQIVLQNIQTASLLQVAINCLDGDDTVEPQGRFDLLHVRVHKHVHQLSVGAPHLLRVHDLVATTDLENDLEKLFIVLETLVCKQLLTAAIIVSD